MAGSTHTTRRRTRTHSTYIHERTGVYWLRSGKIVYRTCHVARSSTRALRDELYTKHYYPFCFFFLNSIIFSTKLWLEIFRLSLKSTANFLCCSCINAAFLFCFDREHGSSRSFLQARIENVSTYTLSIQFFCRLQPLFYIFYFTLCRNYLKIILCL